MFKRIKRWLMQKTLSLLSFVLISFTLLANQAFAACDLVQEGNVYHCPEHLTDPSDTHFWGAVITYFHTIVCSYIGDDGNSYDCHQQGDFTSLGPNWKFRPDHMWECGYNFPESPTLCSFSLTTAFNHPLKN
jgi:hypothetical protein